MSVRPGAKPSHALAQPQGQLFHEDFYSALAGLVAALGGAKVVGARLFPDLQPEAAGRRLLDCLNDERRHQLTPTQVLTLLKWGRAAGHHGAMYYLTDELGYSRPTPVDPEDQRAELQRQFVASVGELMQMAKRLGA